MSKLMTQLLERLAEIFPKNDYQSNLERFIASRNPQTPADVEHWEREFMSHNWS